MEINNLNNSRINAYRSVANTKVNKEKGVAAGKTEVNTDKIEFDFAASIKAATADAISSTNSEVSASKLEQLRAAYSGDSCPVSSEQLADMIVGK